jgi:hypothetical protein
MSRSADHTFSDDPWSDAGTTGNLADLCKPAAASLLPALPLISALSRQMYAPGPQNSLDHGNAPLHRYMLSLDDATNFIEHFDCTFIVGDKQALQNCFESINSLGPRASLQCRMAAKLNDKIVDDVGFLFADHGFASTQRAKHYSIDKRTWSWNAAKPSDRSS